MAGDWITVEHVTPDKPEVFQIAESLTIDPNAVVGALVRIWIWADQQSYEGDAGSVTLASLDRLGCCPGLGKAMLEAGWLEHSAHGFIFPHFDRHNGQTAKRRALTAKRNQVYRAKQRDASSVTEASPENNKTSCCCLEGIDSLDVEEVRAKANQLLPKLYRTPPKRQAAWEAVWRLACFSLAGMSEADVAEAIEAATGPKVRDRADYLQGVLRRKVGGDDQYNAIVGRLPARPPKGGNDELP